MAQKKSIWQKWVEGADGRPLAAASVQVWNEKDGSLATLYSDRDGTALGNPFTSDSAGLATFYADPGRYKITVTSGAFSATMRDQQVGEAKETNPLVVSTGGPTVNDDIDAGYVIGQLWNETTSSPPSYYICEDNAAGAAVWKEMAVLDEVLPLRVQVKEISAAAYTVLDTDIGKHLVFTNAGEVELTINPGIDAGLGDSLGFTFTLETKNAACFVTPQIVTGVELVNLNSHTKSKTGIGAMLTFISSEADRYTWTGDGE